MLCAPDVDSDGEEEDSLGKDYIIDRGIVTLTASDTEKLIRGKIVSSLKTRYPMIESHDFELSKLFKRKFLFFKWEKEPSMITL